MEFTTLGCVEEQINNELSKKNSADHEKVASALMRFVEKPMLVSCDLRTALDFLGKGNTVNYFTRLNETISPKAVLILVREEEGIEMDEFAEMAEGITKFIPAGTPITYAMDIGNEKGVEIVAVS